MGGSIQLEGTCCVTDSVLYIGTLPEQPRSGFALGNMGRIIYSWFLVSQNLMTSITTISLTGEEENGSVGFREALVSNYQSWLEGTQVLEMQSGLEQ